MNRKDGIRALAGRRKRIDALDRRILTLLNQRTRIVEEIGRIKQKLALPVYEPQREDEIFRNVIEHNAGPLTEDALKRIYERVLDEMRSLQRMRNSGQKNQFGVSSRR